MLVPSKLFVIFVLSLLCLVAVGMFGNNKSLSLFAAYADEVRQQQHVTINTTTATPSTPTNSSSTVNFRLHPNMFIKEMMECFDDGNCRIYYFHFGKTGGTSVQERMARYVPPGSLGSCCNARLMKRFRESPKAHCTRKFSSYEVGSNNFLKEVVPTCQSVPQGNTTARAIVLVTFREPHERALSNIHQMCNKNFYKRPKETRQACRRCSYDKDTKFWNEFVETANEQYNGLYQVATASMLNARVLTIDLVDLSRLYEELFAVTQHAAFNVSSSHANPEKTSLCNFGFTSDVFRGLRPASGIYRNLTLGVYSTNS